MKQNTIHDKSHDKPNLQTNSSIIYQIKYMLLYLYDTLEELFDNILDILFPYKGLYQTLHADGYISYYQEKVHKVSFRLILYTFPVYPIIVYLLVFSLSTFVADMENDLFFSCSIPLVLIIFGLILIYGHKLIGCLILYIGLLSTKSFPFLSDASIGYVSVLLSLCNLCRLRRMNYYMSMAKITLKNKIRIATEEETFQHLMDTYGVAFDDMQRKHKEEENDQP